MSNLSRFGCNGSVHLLQLHLELLYSIHRSDRDRLIKNLRFIPVWEQSVTSQRVVLWSLLLCEFHEMRCSTMFELC